MERNVSGKGVMGKCHPRQIGSRSGWLGSSEERMVDKVRDVGESHTE